MKERSVEFYKKLIIYSGIIFLIILGLLAGFLIEKVIEDKKDKNVLQGGSPENTVTAQKNDTEQKGDPEPEFDFKDAAAVVSEEEEANPQGDNERLIYLRFDDGASQNTDEILDILKDKGIKATFFFNTSEMRAGDRIIKRAFQEGHALGGLTSKNLGYSQIYSSPEEYGMDLDRALERISDLTGKRPVIMRFPGGSKNGFTAAEYEGYIKQIELRKLVYFDWDICADGYGRGVESLVANGTKVPEGKGSHILLMHDNGNPNTCAALKRIIDFYESRGYSFGKLTEEVNPIRF